MPQLSISHYCQKCRAANPLGQEFCSRCGTKLMLIVEPPSSRVDSAEHSPQDEYLLERLTILENTMARLTERLEQRLKLLLRQSETAYTNHALVKSLMEILGESGIVDQNRLKTMWRAECEQAEAKDNPSVAASASSKKSRKARQSK